MTLAAALTRCPRPWSRDRGEEVAAQVSLDDPQLSALVAGAAGCSPYLAHLITREATWLPGAFDAPDAALADVLMPIDPQDPNLKSLLRQAKRRVALLAGLADLGGAWRLEQVTQALTDLADMACEAALRAAVAAQV